MSQPVGSDRTEAEHGAPRLIEKYGGFTTYWFCEPPPWDSKFQVLRDHWRDGGEQPIREVYEIKVTQGEPLL